MRLYYGGYGHHPSGKEYVYWGSDGFNVGQNVVAPVTNYRSGQTYNTMFTIQRTSDSESDMSNNESQRLSQGGIGIKSIKDTNILELPGGQKFKNANRSDRASKGLWSKDSNKRYNADIRERLLGDSFPADNQDARNQLLGGYSG